MKHATVLLYVFLRAFMETQKASKIYHALKKLVLGIKDQKRKLYLKRIPADSLVKKRLTSSENKH